MSFLDLFNLKKATTVDKDRIAELLNTNRSLLDAFEQSYQLHALSEQEEDLFAVNSRQAANTSRIIDDNTPLNNEELIQKATALRDQIVNELLARTYVYTFDGNLQSVTALLPTSTKEVDPITNDTIKGLPPSLRPQLTGNSCVMDINEDSSASLFFYYDRMNNKSLPKEERQLAYHQFRQGLDILDLDPITYEMLGMNRNSMGHWLPQLVTACTGQGFFKIPATKIAKVPLPILQMTRLDYNELTPVTRSIINEWAMKAFALDDTKDYFIKTGTYSSKFDFRNAHVTGAKEVHELGEYLTYIQYQAQMMAGTLCSRPTYGVSTTNEWVVREFIEDKENNPCIYKGLPLHTEYRVFVDCDTNEVLAYNPYWDAAVMLQRFGHEEDADSPHQIHDYIIYKAYAETLMKRYNENVQSVVEHINTILPKLSLHGQWSIDIMQNGDDFWIIDMAVAENSAFYDKVPMELRRPFGENWLPSLDHKPVWLLPGTNEKGE